MTTGRITKVISDLESGARGPRAVNVRASVS